MAPVQAPKGQLQLQLRFPDSSCESVSVDASSSGIAVLTKMLPLKRRKQLPEDMQIYRPDGAPLELDRPLARQGLFNGATLLVAELNGFTTSVGAAGEQVRVGHYRVSSDVAATITPPAVSSSSPTASPSENLEEARRLKTLASEKLKAGEAHEAKQLLSSALAKLPSECEDEFADVDERRSIVADLLLGRGLARLKLKEWLGARDDAEQCLCLQPESTAALFLLATCLAALGDFAAARARLGWLLLKQPGHRAARQALADIEFRRRAAHEGGRSAAPDMERPD